MLKRVLSLVAIVALAGVTLAADPIKIELKNFKWKSANATGGDDLGGYDEGQDRFFFYSFGTGSADVDLPADGEYAIVIDAKVDADMV